jgi:hypothetical protein
MSELTFCYDPLLQDYIQQVAALKRCSPAPTEIPFAPKHQPYICGPRVVVPKEPLPPLPVTQPTPIPTDHPTATVTCGFQHLSNWLISFGIIKPSGHSDQTSHHCLYNSEIIRTASMLAHFDWAVYGFNSGYFVSAISDRGMPFHIIVAYDPYSNRRSLFQSITTCTHVLDGALALLDCITSSGITSKLIGYLIHSHRYNTSKPTKRFGDIQSQIVAQL